MLLQIILLPLFSKDTVNIIRRISEGSRDTENLNNHRNKLHCNIYYNTKLLYHIIKLLRQYFYYNCYSALGQLEDKLYEHNESQIRAHIKNNIIALILFNVNEWVLLVYDTIFNCTK